jgi:hypothetical protein
MVCAPLLPACGALLGLDQGSPLLGEGDASSDATTSLPLPSPEAGVQGPDGVVPSSPRQEGGSPVDDSGPAERPESGPPGRDSAADAGCTPDPGWCNSHCGVGPDNCGGSRTCPATCAAGYTCGSGNVCQCQTESDWCNGRCGQTTDNCNKPIDCGASCPPSCTAESMQLACGDRQCGQVTNNCSQKVNCGFLGLLSGCLSNSQVCLADGGCCTPDTASACGNQCGTSVVDNCGRTVACPTSCGSGRVCRDKVCCTPTDPCGGACGVTQMNNCGQTVQCGCASGAECLSDTNTCCVPQGCSANCVDSCGVAAASCCVPEAGPPEAGLGDAGSDLGETGTETTSP